MQNLDARAERSRKAILQAGLELLNKNREAALTEIAAHAGVGRATLYRQFESREQLIKSIAIDCHNRMEIVSAPIDSEAKSALDAIRLLFEYVIPLSEELQFLMQLDTLAENESELLAIQNQQKREMMELIEMAKTEGSIEKKMPNEWVANLIESLFYVAWITQKEQGYSCEKMAELTFSTLCKGIKPKGIFS